MPKRKIKHDKKYTQLTQNIDKIESSEEDLLFKEKIQKNFLN